MNQSTSPPALTSTSLLASRGLWAAVVTVFIWSAFIVIARASASLSLTAFDIVWLRFVGAGMVMLPWGWWLVRRQRQTAPDQASWLGLSPLGWRMTVAVGMVAGVGYSMIAYSGFFFAPAAHASVLMPGLLPLWTALLAWGFLGERITRSRGLALCLLVGGALMVGGPSLLKAFGGGNVWKGDVLFMCGSFTWSCYSVLARKHKLQAVPTTIAICIFCVLTYVPVYAVLAFTGVVVSHLAHAPWAEVAFQLVVQGMGSVVISGITYTSMVQHYGPTRATMVTALVPGLSALGAVMFLGEPLGQNLIFGLLLVSIGIVLGVRAASAQAPQSETKPQGAKA